MARCARRRRFAGLPADQLGPAGAPTVLAAVAFSVERASQESDITYPLPPVGKNPLGGGPTGHGKDVHKALRNDVHHGGVQDMPEEDLHLWDTLLSSGKGGKVVRGKVGGRDAAVKLVPTADAWAEMLLTEAENYLHVRKLWGKYVPRMLAYGTTCDGEVTFLATELIDGVPISAVKMSPTIARAARKALKALHKAGLVHCDIQPLNFLLLRHRATPRRSGPRVMVLDFGFSVPLDPQYDLQPQIDLDIIELDDFVRILSRSSQGASV